MDVSFWNRIRSWSALGLAAFGFLAAANVLEAVPLEQSTVKAPFIVYGKIQRARVANASTATGVLLPFTFFDMQVTEVMKGDIPEKQITFLQKGGGNLNTEGSATFHEGENVVVFLNDKNLDGSYELRGLKMGKLIVEPGEVLKGPAITADARWSAEHGDQSARSTWTLNDLRALIHPAHEVASLTAAKPGDLTPELKRTIQSTSAPIVPEPEPASASLRGLVFFILLGVAALAFLRVHYSSK